MTHLLAPPTGRSERRTLCGMFATSARLEYSTIPCTKCYGVEQERKDRAQAAKAPPPDPSAELIDPVLDPGRWRDVRVTEYVNQGWTDYEAIAVRVIQEHEELVAKLTVHVKTKAPDDPMINVATDSQFADAVLVSAEQAEAQRRKRYAAPAGSVPLTRKEKPVAINFKEVLVESLKSGAATGTMQALSDEVYEVLKFDYPQIEFLPPELRHAMICYAINVAGNAAPDLPGFKAAAAISERAFQGLMTNSVSSTVQVLIKKVKPVFARLAESERESAKLLRGIKS